MVEIAENIVFVNEALRVVAHVDARLGVAIHLVVRDVRVGGAATGDPRTRVLTNVVVSDVG